MINKDYEAGKAISILIPTYNDECFELVETLQRQCERLTSTAQSGSNANKGGGNACAALGSYEIIVADDGSDDKDVVESNRRIDKIENCRYIIYKENRGRAAIRNALAREAKYDCLLFIDSDVTIENADFIERYVVSLDETACFNSKDRLFCVCGGYRVPRNDGMNGNLRYMYELACGNSHKVGMRRKNPYKSFNSSNFLVSRNVMEMIPFDERFHLYGYEDVAFGRQLRKAGIEVKHIDNPVAFHKLENNATYVAQTEEGMGNLADFSDILEGYSRLLATVGTLHKWHIDGLCRRVLHPFMRMMRCNLTGGKPSLRLFNVYKLTVLLCKMHYKRQQKQG